MIDMRRPLKGYNASSITVYTSRVYGPKAYDLNGSAKQKRHRNIEMSSVF